MPAGSHRGKNLPCIGRDEYGKGRGTRDRRVASAYAAAASRGVGTTPGSPGGEGRKGGGGTQRGRKGGAGPVKVVVLVM